MSLRFGDEMKLKSLDVEKGKRERGKTRDEKWKSFLQDPLLLGPSMPRCPFAKLF